MGFTLDISISAFTVFVQGLLSFFSPCVFPLIPVYIGYLSGGTAVKDEEGQMHYDRVKVMVNTLFFVLGISFAFFLLGLGMTALGRFFGGNQLLFARIGGVIIILFGLFQLGVFGSPLFLNKERRIPFSVEKMAMSPVTALLMGFTFSFAWTPCVGPTLSGVLLMAASAEKSSIGFLLVGVYTLGFVLPFLLVGFFTTSILKLFEKHRNVVRYTVKIGGALMILMGILMILGKMNGISGYFAQLGQGTQNSQSSVQEKMDTDNDSIEREGTGAGNAAGNASQENSGTTENTGSKESDKATENGETLENGQTSEKGQTTEDDSYPVFPAPDFTLNDQYGNTHTLSDYKGKVVFLNFWATWCPPCRAEMPDIQALYEEYQKEDDPEVVILGAAFPGFGSEKDEEGVRAFLEENGYTYPTVMNLEGDLILSYYITAYPTTYMIDKEGNIFGYVTGSMDKHVMQSIIDQTIAGR